MATETQRLWSEAREICATPLDREGYGMIGTVALLGATALIYSADNSIRGEMPRMRGTRLDEATSAGNLIANPLLHLGAASLLYGGAVLDDSAEWIQKGELQGASLLLADSATYVIKEAVGRVRPFVRGRKDRFVPARFKSDHDSFPSMHTASSFAIASVVSSWPEGWGGKLIAYVAASFVSFSRVGISTGEAICFWERQSANFTPASHKAPY